MEYLETYNRVPSLESPYSKSILIIGRLLLIAISLAAASSSLWNKQPWDLTLSIVMGSLLAYIILSIARYRREKICQYCKQPLDYVIRPFFLNQEHLSKQGTKRGDHFYTQCYWGGNPLQRRWAKISNRSLACHHCRLSEERQAEHYEVGS